jgi:hypothetical protein
VSTKIQAFSRRSTAQDPRVVAWRRDQLRATGFPEALAEEAATDERLDLHAVIELVERGCPPRLAVRILAPIDEPRDELCSGRAASGGAARRHGPRRR